MHQLSSHADSTTPPCMQAELLSQQVQDALDKQEAQARSQAEHTRELQEREQALQEREEALQEREAAAKALRLKVTPPACLMRAWPLPMRTSVSLLTMPPVHTRMCRQKS